LIERFQKLLAACLCMVAGLASAQTMNDQPKTATATLAGGCFWCMEAIYQTVPGVLKITSGFAGGTVPNPSYEDVCTGTTGHAESIQIQYDPSKISYEKILDLFWKAHDPTTLNRQGNDEGTQYRSVIFYGNDQEKAIADKSKAAAQADFKDPIVTQIVPLQIFYPAEKYHQNYFNDNPGNPYCSFVIRPKVDKFKKETGE
jgi:peptide-methionine (S)-S-oxide reductase